MLDDRIICPIDECIIGSLILDDTHLGINIVLHLEVVTIQVVWRDIQQDGNISTEIVHVIELE